MKHSQIDIPLGEHQTWEKLSEGDVYYACLIIREATEGLDKAAAAIE